MDENRLKELIARYKAGTLTQEEKALLDAWYLHLSQQPEPSVSEKDLQQRLDRIWKELTINPVQNGHYRQFIAYFSVAALLLIGFGIHFNKSSSDGITKKISQTDISPRTNKAVLTLANGRKVALSSQQDGIVVGDETVTYHDGTSIDQASDDSDLAITATAKLSLTTPRGGQYRVVLSDGTKVWLNAVSTLTYPAKFTGNKREVEIMGEAYFEVAHALLPFVVRTRDQEVTVLGTEFNVNAYTEDVVAKTTVVSGAVRVDARGESLYLEPGEQAISGHTLHKKKADIDVAIGWKSEIFVFKDEPLPSILLQLSRWYDVEVDYSGVSDIKLDGEIPRTFTLEEVIRSLEAGSQIKFTLNEGRLTVK